MEVTSLYFSISSSSRNIPLQYHPFQLHRLLNHQKQWLLFQHILKVADTAFILILMLLGRIILKILTQVSLGSCFF